MDITKRVEDYNTTIEAQKLPGPFYGEDLQSVNVIKTQEKLFAYATRLIQLKLKISPLALEKALFIEHVISPAAVGTTPPDISKELKLSRRQLFASALQTHEDGQGLVRFALYPINDKGMEAFHVIEQSDSFFSKATFSG